MHPKQVIVEEKYLDCFRRRVITIVIAAITNRISRNDHVVLFQVVNETIKYSIIIPTVTATTRLDKSPNIFLPTQPKQIPIVMRILPIKPGYQ